MMIIPAANEKTSQISSPGAFSLSSPHRRREKGEEALFAGSGKGRSGYFKRLPLPFIPFPKGRGD